MSLSSFCEYVGNQFEQLSCRDADYAKYVLRLYMNVCSDVCKFIHFLSKVNTCNEYSVVRRSRNKFSDNDDNRNQMPANDLNSA